MIVSALTATDRDLWWLALGLGLVVIVVVFVLLRLLVSFVERIDRNVAETWDSATRLAANTSTTWMLDQLAVQTGLLRSEIERHADVLGSEEP